MTDFIEAIELDKVPAGKGVAVTVNGKDIAIFNVGGNIHAIEDRCLHQGALLSPGDLNGKVVTCRKHGWRYDVTTGFVAHVPDYGVGCYESKIEDGKIFLKV